MIIAVHTAIGVIIAQKTKTALIAFIVGVILHFVLDFIPHGDRKILQWFSRKINRDLILSLNVLDAFITIVYLLYIFTYGSIQSTGILFWAIMGSILPDFIHIYAELFKVKILKPYSKFHDFIHDYIPSKMTMKEGLMLQFVIIILLVYITI